MAELLDEHRFAAAPDHVTVTVCRSLYLGILAFWTNDTSPTQEETRALIDDSVRVFVETISGPGAEAGDDHAA